MSKPVPSESRSSNRASSRHASPTKDPSTPPASSTKSASSPQPDVLKGWKQISEFLGEPASVVQRWASTGMPVHREGRFVTTTTKALNQWLGQQSGKPVHIITDETDLTSELKRGLSFVRKAR
ncbi:MAG: hypothetical protein WA477_21535 [Candidatus Sulfotelmatobacter sp.]